MFSLFCDLQALKIWESRPEPDLTVGHMTLEQMKMTRMQTSRQIQLQVMLKRMTRLWMKNGRHRIGGQEEILLCIQLLRV
jgi:hypothetical protein